jgi:hypothetical protein
MTNEWVLREFYGRTGLTEKWLRQRANERQTWAPSKARMDRARSMAKMTGQHLLKHGDEWLLVNREAKNHYKAAFDRGDGRPFNHIENELFGALEAKGEIPYWLTSHLSTWRAIQALLGC